MTAKDYKVTFPYGATTPPYSLTNPHRGEDRKMPKGTPIEVNGVLVGYAGTTGKSTGVHTHTQRQDKSGRVIHPRGGGFDVPQPTVVTATGYNEEIGNFVRYKDGNGEIWSIFHMDSPAVVQVGQQLKEEIMVADKSYVQWVVDATCGRAAREDEIKQFVGWEQGQLFKSYYFSQEATDYRKRITLTPTHVDKNIKMGLRREPTAQELGNQDYQRNAGLLIDTLWNNGGEALYKSNSTSFVPVTEQLFKKG